MGELGVCLGTRRTRRRRTRHAGIRTDLRSARPGVGRPPASRASRWPSSLPAIGSSRRYSRQDVEPNLFWRVVAPVDVRVAGRLAVLTVGSASGSTGTEGNHRSTPANRSWRYRVMTERAEPSGGSAAPKASSTSGARRLHRSAKQTGCWPGVRRDHQALRFGPDRGSEGSRAGPVHGHSSRWSSSTWSRRS